MLEYWKFKLEADLKPRVVFMGTPDFAVLSLDAIVKAGYEVAAVVTVPDRKVGRGQKVAFSPVKNYALEHNLPLLQPEKLRDESFISQLREIGADLFVVVAFRMLPQVVWSMPKMGTFNLHASLLPQYRGAAPINWAIINGEKETGVTTFLLNERIDEGGLLMQRSTLISENETAETLHDRLAEMGAEMVVETIKGLEDGSLKARPQVECDNLKPAPKIFKEDCVIDWSRGGEEIERFVRGLSPYPSAMTVMSDEGGGVHSFKIYEVSYEKAVGYVEGAVESDGKTCLKVGCKDGCISILSLQIEGKRRNSIEEFLRGSRVNSWKIVK